MALAKTISNSRDNNDGQNVAFDTVTLPESPCVYLLRADSGLWKIGRSVNVAGRFETIRSAAWRHAGVETELFHVIECGDLQASIDLERELHGQFADKRRDKLGRTEWFRLSEEDVREIASIRRREAGKTWRLDSSWSAKLNRAFSGIISTTQKILIGFAVAVTLSIFVWASTFLFV
jgi:hypothetical protein